MNALKNTNIIQIRPARPRSVYLSDFETFVFSPDIGRLMERNP